MKNLFTISITLWMLTYTLNAQSSERISQNGISYFDPEINHELGLMAYQKPGGEIWIAKLDPITGLFSSPFGDDEQVGDNAAPLIQSFNGPEFGYDANAWCIVYTKEENGSHQVWQIKNENGVFVSSPVAVGQEVRQSALASKNPDANSIRIVYSIGGFEGVMAWKDLSDLGTEVVIDSVDRGIRWIDHSNKLAYIKQTGIHSGEIAIYDTDTATEEIISSDGRSKSNCYGWFAPEYDDELLVACLIDNDQGIAVYKKTNGTWDLFLELEIPTTSPYQYFGSPEAFVAAGKSYLSCVVKAQENAYSNSEVWFLSLGETLGLETKVQLKMEDEQGAIIRTDPETYIGQNEAFIYYNLITNNNTFEMYRARTNLETLNSDNISYHYIKPTATDPNISGNNEHHYVMLDQSVGKRNKLLVYFAGSRARPYDYLKFSKTAASLGYHVIVLSYENLTDVNYSACGGTTDETCHGRARREIWTGDDTHERLNITPANSILNRLRKLLEYLEGNYPEDNWQQYLEDSNIVWENIVVAGHSQGGGHAGFAAKLFEVDRSIMIAASDWVQNQTALWIRTPGPTPDDRYYGFIHLEDTPAINIIMPTWEDYGILNHGTPVIVDNNTPPYNNVHGLITNTIIPDENVRAHNFVIVDLVTPNAEDYDGYLYSDVWKYLLRNEETTALYGPEPSGHFNIYPNPTNDYIYLSDENTPYFEAYLYHQNGQLVKSIKSEAQVFVGDLVNGVYFIKIKTGYKTLTYKFVKQ